MVQSGMTANLSPEKTAWVVLTALLTFQSVSPSS
jgi:hypothetical protein